MKRKNRIGCAGKDAPRPVGVREFIHSKRYLGLKGVAYPVVVDTLEEIFEGGYREAVLSWGIGSGKSFLASLALTYLLYRTLRLPDPQGYYGLAPGAKIILLNMALSAGQATRVVFDQVARFVDESQWFQNKRQPVNRMRNELEFRNQVVLLAGNSSERFPLGYNLLGAVLDEAGWYVEGSEDGRRDQAEEIFNALQRRITSRFGERGLLIVCSSPRHEEDFMERKLQEARRFKWIYGSRRAAWEVKPPEQFRGEYFEHEGLQIPVEYEDDFRRNAERAMRDLAARPARGMSLYFRDIAALEKAKEGMGGPPVDEQGWPVEQFVAEDDEPRYVHVDLGLTRDACGIAMAHCKGAEDALGEPQAIVDFVWRIPAPPGGEIDIDGVVELIFELVRRGFSIAQVSYDGWQSASSIQRLRGRDINATVVSVDRDLSAYDTLKELVNLGRLRICDFEPFFGEARRLRLIRGVKVDHPPGGSKDVTDAVAGAVSEAVKAWRGEVTARIV